jgi:hypothetical protein
MFDVLTGWTRGSMADRKAADLAAVHNGDSRIVRSYLKPGPDEHRWNKVWKAGLFVVSTQGAQWKGSQKKWGTVDLPAASWITSSRQPTSDDYPGKRAMFNVIECRNDAELYIFGVPKPDTELVLAILSNGASAQGGEN